ncbi:glycosyltransferase family 2 protein [Candidatus Woesebacteria bacterium]|nr:glycosyltransferase family 2 protein [Candidatus Woesebacteria bacterium]
MKRKRISIGIPCFNEEKNVEKAYTLLKQTTSKIKNYTFEFIFVDNGSNDRTRDRINSLVKKDTRVTGIFLSRNFGPEASGQAALDHSTADAFIFYEADMQDPPSLIATFIHKWEQGYQIILGIRDKIEDPALITAARKLFYKIFKSISNIEVPINAGSYGLIDKKVMHALAQIPEKYRFYRGLRAWVGFKTAYVHYKRKKRQFGISSYNLYQYIKHSERGIFGFSYLVLDIMIYFGFLLVIASFLFIIGYLLLFLFFGNPIKGAVTILVSIVFFGGIQLLAISIIGKYIQVVVEETKARPIYIIDEIINKT